MWVCYNTGVPDKVVKHKAYILRCLPFNICMCIIFKAQRAPEKRTALSCSVPAQCKSPSCPHQVYD